MRIFLIFQIWIVVSLSFSNSCVLSSGQIANSGTTNPQQATSSAKNFPEFCTKLVGKWQIYRSATGKGTKMCGNRPCGIQEPNLNLVCENNVLKGTSLQAVNSADFDTPKTYLYDISSSVEEQYLIFRFVDSFGCKVTYKFNEIEENRLFGQWSASDCAVQVYPIDNGDILALRHTKAPE